MKNINGDDEGILINILIDDQLDIERESRSPRTEENYNLAVLSAMAINEYQIRFNDTTIDYEEINYSRLKEIRNDKQLLKEYLMELYIYDGSELWFL